MPRRPFGTSHYGPRDGDKVSSSCRACGERYKRIVGQEDAGGGDYSRCRQCANAFEALDRVGGSLRIRDEEDRQKVAQNIEDEEFGVWVDERVGDLWIYRK